jgi:hypothetical protein
MGLARTILLCVWNGNHHNALRVAAKLQHTSAHAVASRGHHLPGQLRVHSVLDSPRAVLHQLVQQTVGEEIEVTEGEEALKRGGANTHVDLARHSHIAEVRGS